MTKGITRRQFVATSAGVGSAAVLIGPSAEPGTALAAEADLPALRLGLMTYQLGQDWDIDTIIKNCRAAQWEHAELRTTHGHGVEISLSKAQRREVRTKFEDAGIKLSLASAFAYHWPSAKQLRESIEGTKKYVLLARDIGARGIRVFANAILTDQGIAQEQTLAQIGRAVAAVGSFAADYGVEIRLSNHGKGTNRVTIIRKILDHADCPHVYVNWNCDKTDVEDPGFEANFNLVKDRIRNIHMHELFNASYPYRKLFTLLRQAKYAGYCDAEVGQSCEPISFMKYYRALFLALQDVM